MSYVILSVELTRSSISGFVPKCDLSNLPLQAFNKICPLDPEHQRRTERRSIWQPAHAGYQEGVPG